jgi:hypothetical protein
LITFGHGHAVKLSDGHTRQKLFTRQVGVINHWASISELMVDLLTLFTQTFNFSNGAESASRAMGK